MLGAGALGAPVIGGLMVDLTGSSTMMLQLGSLTCLLVMILVVMDLTKKRGIACKTVACISMKGEKSPSKESKHALMSAILQKVMAILSFGSMISSTP